MGAAHEAPRHGAHHRPRPSGPAVSTYPSADGREGSSRDLSRGTNDRLRGHRHQHADKPARALPPGSPALERAARSPRSFAAVSLAAHPSRRGARRTAYDHLRLAFADSLLAMELRREDVGTRRKSLSAPHYLPRPFVIRIVERGGRQVMPEHAQVVENVRRKAFSASSAVDQQSVEIGPQTFRILPHGRK